jgi:hypothetical protein
MTCLGVNRLVQSFWGLHDATLKKGETCSIFFCLFVGYDVILKGRICSIWSSVLPSCDDTRTLC